MNKHAKRSQIRNCRFSQAVLIYFFLNGSLIAQNNNDPNEIATLREYVVKGISAAESIIPLAETVDSVFGNERSLMEAPRGVSVITEALLRDRDVDSVADMVELSPGAYSPSSYGNNTTPNIRGDVAETYINGQRRSANIFGIDPSFNSIESIDVVRGPGSVAYGPGFESGGYVNYVTKKPHLDDFFTTLSLRLGAWVPGHTSYFSGSFGIDHNLPLVADKLALRVSYDGQENETFFHQNGGREDSQDLFLALSWRPHEKLSLDWNAQYIWQAAPQLLGVNRPHNGLIQNNEYLNGVPTDPAQIAPDFFSIRTHVTGTSDFQPEQTLLSIGDFSNANIVRTQLVTELQVSAGLKLVNRTFAEFIKRRRHHEFSYTEYVRQFTFETRTEAHSSFRLFGFKQEGIAGMALRFEEREAYMNYFNYYPYAYDITAGNSFRAEDLFGLFGQPGPGGKLFFGSEEGIPETTHSKVWNPALFWQQEMDLNDRLSLLYGLRVNAYFADVTDPLPPPGATAAWNDNHDFYSFDFNTSLIYRPSEKFTLYGTFNRTHALNGSTGGGAIMLSGGKLDGKDFDTRSDLYEIGARLSLLEDHLYISATAFRQARNRSELGGGRSGIRVRGVELEGVYQPNEQFHLLANLAYSHGNYRNASPFALGGADLNGLFDIAVADFADPSLIGVDGQVVAGDYRLSGFSRWIFNGGASWRLENGIGFRLWSRVQSPQNGNLLAQYVIPTQFTLNAGISLKKPAWEISLSLLNLTDERNWSHNGDEFGSNVFIAHQLPLRMEGLFTIHF